MAEFIMNTTNMPDHVLEVLRIWYINNEQIVRCKDCRHYYQEMETCLYFDRGQGEPDGFCKWGEITANDGIGEAVE